MSVTRSSVALGLVVAVVLAASAAGGAGVVATDLAPCAKGTVNATIGGKRVCLRSGQRCSKRFDRQYHAYWLHCHSARLASFPRAGKIVASIPVPAVGGMVIGGGYVWVANMNPRTITQIDPGTNDVVATIPLGEPDFLWGPTRLAFGHGSLWAIDGMTSSVFRIDPQTKGIVATIPLGTPTQFSTGPLGIVVTADAVWVTNVWGSEVAPDGFVARIDPASNRIVAVIPAGSHPEAAGAKGIAAQADAVWVAVPSTRSIIRIDPSTDSVVATIPGLTCADGHLAADESNVWVADCKSVHRIDAQRNAVTKTIAMPRATGLGVIGVAVGLGSLWVQAGPLVRIDPASGAVSGVLPLAEVINDCAYGIVFGFDSVWVRQHDWVVRIQP